MEIKEKKPESLGWLEVELDEKHVNHLWDCINTARGGSFKDSLVGQIEKSYHLPDKNDIFWKEVIEPCVNKYGEVFGHGWNKMATTPEFRVKPYLETMWVNYQNAGEYQPIHDHSGLYSFAIWLVNPVDYFPQAFQKNSDGASTSFNNTFCFQHLNILGQQKTTLYPMGKNIEGWMVFFPAQLNHTVYPFYGCDKQRISISGNVMLKEDTSSLTIVD